MKNIFKVFSIIAMVALIAFSFTACEEPEDPGDDGVQKTLVITNVPATTTAGDVIAGKQVTIAIYGVDNKSKGNIVALDQLNIPANTTAPTTLTSYLVSGNEKKNGSAFTGTGDFYIFLLIDVPGTPADLDDDVAYAYGGGSSTLAKKVPISNASTSVDFTQFFKKTN